MDDFDRRLKIIEESSTQKQAKESVIKLDNTELKDDFKF